MSARNEKTGDAEIIEMPLGDKLAPPVDAAPAPKKRNTRRYVIIAAVPVLLAAVGGYFYFTGGRYQETDNAYVEQAKVSISSDVAGRIVMVWSGLYGADDLQVDGDDLYVVEGHGAEISRINLQTMTITGRRRA